MLAKDAAEIPIGAAWYVFRRAAYSVFGKADEAKPLNSSAWNAEEGFGTEGEHACRKANIASSETPGDAIFHSNWGLTGAGADA
jgi:hypothetical protein